jgi:hypothetical protein
MLAEVGLQKEVNRPTLMECAEKVAAAGEESARGGGALTTVPMRWVAKARKLIRFMWDNVELYYSQEWLQKIAALAIVPVVVPVVVPVRATGGAGGGGGGGSRSIHRVLEGADETVGGAVWCLNGIPTAVYP